MGSGSRELVLLQDISALVVSSHDLEQTLDNITALISKRLEVEVCSLYLLEGARLVLRSTRGLSPTTVGKLSMNTDEGLTGLVFESVAPVNVSDVEAHSRHKYFADSGEEAFHSYLGVPLIHARRPSGVLTVQTKAARKFSPNEVSMMVAAAGQMASIIAHARLLARQTQGDGPDRVQKQAPPFVRGIGVSRGVGRGEAYPLTDELDVEALAEHPAETPEQELEDFEAALNKAIASVMALRDEVSASLTEEDGAIFHAHLLMLEDSSFQGKIRARIREGEGAAHAVAAVGHSYIDAFTRLEDQYLRERAADVKDVAHRLIGHLLGSRTEESVRFKRPTILLASDLSASQFARMIQPNLAGVVLARGGATSHTAILCRSADVPAVVGVELDPHAVEEGKPVIIDGESGLVYLDPPPAVDREYAEQIEDAGRRDAELRAHLDKPPVTADGVAVGLLGNAALMADVPKIVDRGGEGIGLYRTELPFLIRSTFPDEEEQYRVYSAIVEKMNGLPVVFRTLDVGGDKPLPYLDFSSEENPQLGWRAIRVSMGMEQMFRAQIRAILRASKLGPIRIMFPMIIDPAEFDRAALLVEEQMAALEGEVGEVEVGTMIETPASALCVERLARRSSFFSVGSNDLTQYLLAVDRGNARVAHLYDSLHPSLLSLLRDVVRASARAERPLSVCGEMSATPLGVAALLAVGVRTLSVNPGALLQIRRFVQSVEAAPLAAMADRLITAADASEVRTLLADELGRQGLCSEFLG